MLTALMENTLAIIDGIMILCAFLNEKIQPKIIYKRINIGAKIHKQIILISFILFEISSGRFIHLMFEISFKTSGD